MVDSSKKTPLSYARDSGYTSIAQHLLDKRAGIWPMNPVLKGHRDHVQGVLFSANGHFMLSESVDKTIRIWDVDTGLTRITLRKSELKPIWNGRCGEAIRVYASEDLKSAENLDLRKAILVQLGSNPDLHHLYHIKLQFPLPASGIIDVVGLISQVICMKEDRWKEWKPVPIDQSISRSRSGEAVIRYGMRQSSYGIERLPRQPVYPELDWSGTPDLFCPVREEQLNTPLLKNDPQCRTEDAPRCLTFSSDSKRMAVLTGWDVVKIYDVDSADDFADVTKEFRPDYTERLPVLPAWFATALAFSPNGRLLASACSDNTIRLWKL